MFAELGPNVVKRMYIPGFDMRMNAIDECYCGMEGKGRGSSEGRHFLINLNNKKRNYKSGNW